MKDLSELYHDQMTGKLALAYAMVTNRQYLEALEIQKQHKEARKPALLRTIFLDYGMLKPVQLELLDQAKKLLTIMRKEQRFGSIAIGKGFLTEQELDQALQVQKQEKKEIGRILLDLGFLNQNQVDEILALQKSSTIRLPTVEDVRRMQEAGPALHAKSQTNPLILNVSEDALVAVIVLPDTGTTVDVTDIRDFLENQGIRYGIMDDETIRTILHYRHLGLNCFIAALGQKSSLPIADPPVLHFRPSSMCLEDLDETPSPVKAKTLLAERRIIKKSIPRITVFGVAIEDTESFHQIFFAGNGCRMDENRGRIFATIDGEPFYHPDGAVCVIGERTLDDLTKPSETFVFDGRIRIRGRVSNNVFVRGIHVRCNEINGASIRADGDLRVDKALKNATVICAGTLRADTIENCRISCLGDVKVKGDIRESTIDTHGRCVAGQGIFSSHVRAIRGIESVKAVSQDLRPSHLESGIFFTPGYIREDESLAETTARDLSNMASQIHSQENLLRLTGRVILDIKRDLKKMDQELRAVSNTVARMEEKTKRVVTTGRKRIVDLNGQMASAQDIMDVLSEDSQRIEEDLGSLKKSLRIKIKNYREIKARISRKTAVIKQRFENYTENACIRIEGLVQGGTVIRFGEKDMSSGGDREGIVIDGQSAGTGNAVNTMNTD